jgi:hypothetical protein
MPVPSNTRTYLPKLLTVMLLACNYIGRYRVTILKWLPSNSEPALDAVVDACAILAAIVEDTLST